MTPVGDGLAGLLTRGQSALGSGDWAAARACFEEAARLGNPAGGLDGLAQALFSQGDDAGAIDRGEQAFAAFRARGEDVRAAVCARLVGYLHGVVYGNGAAMRGWMGRAVRRAQDWLVLADRFVERTNQIPIGAICRTHYGGVLTAAGRWD